MPPAAAGAALVAGGVAAASKLGKGIDFGTGRNDARAQTFQSTSDYDPNAFNYGGRAGGADDASKMYNNTAAGYTGGAYRDFTTGANSLGNANAVRGNQVEAMNMMRDRAMGKDLISSRLADVQRGKLIGEEQSIKASARGPGGVALASQSEAGATAQGLAGIGQQETIAGMTEQRANQEDYLGAGTGIREGDIGTTNAATSAGSAQGQLGLGYSNLGNKVEEDRMQGAEARQGLLEGSQRNSQNTNVGVEQANAANQWNAPKMLLGGATGAAGIGVDAAKASDPLAKTGISPLGGSMTDINSRGGEQLAAGGGEDVGATIQKMAAQPKEGQTSNPLSAGIAGRPVVGGLSLGGISDPAAKDNIRPAMWQPASDPEAKKETYTMGVAHGAAHAVRQFLSSRAGQDTAAVPSFVMRSAPTAQAALTSPAAADVAPIPARIARSVAPGGKPAAPPARSAETSGAYLEADKPRMTQTKKGESLPIRDTYRVESGDDAELEGRPTSDPRAKTLGPAQATAATEGLVSRAKSAVSRAASKASAFGDRVNQSVSDAAGRLYPDADGPPVSDPKGKLWGGVHDNEVTDTLDTTPAVSYKYKDPKYEPEAQRPGERQAGFLTTDLKKTPLGAAVVERRPDGMEGYNRHRLDGLQHAEISNLHERMRDLEAEIFRLKGGSRGG